MPERRSPRKYSPKVTQTESQSSTTERSAERIAVPGRKPGSGNQAQQRNIENDRIAVPGNGQPPRPIAIVNRWRFRLRSEAPLSRAEEHPQDGLAAGRRSHPIATAVTQRSRIAVSRGDDTHPGASHAVTLSPAYRTPMHKHKKVISTPDQGSQPNPGVYTVQRGQLQQFYASLRSRRAPVRGMTPAAGRPALIATGL